MPEFKRESTAKDYRQILIDSRKRQLRLTATAVRRLEITFNAAIESIAQKIESLPAERVGTPWHRAALQLTADIRTVMDGLKADGSKLLDVGMVELAQNAADREAATANLVGADKDPSLFPDLDQTFVLSNSQEIAVSFGRLALRAVERVATRYYRDGLKLSDRLYRIDVRARKVIEDTITQGIVEGTSARDLAKRLREVMKDASVSGQPTPMHQLMRITRTEINNAHREASILSTQTSPGELKPYISGVRWNLSLSHPESDICDVWAAHDSGMGPGIYLPDSVPVDHPHGLCFLTTVLKEFPDSGIGGKKPDVGNVPESMLRYYSEQGDGPATALLQGVGG